MNEQERLRQLEKFQAFGVEPMPEFDRLAELARRVFSVPMAAVTLIGDEKQLFKARCGFDVAESDRKSAFCARTIQSDEVFVVRDAAAHPDFRDSLLVVAEPRVRFYAGAPLVVGPGVRLGALCILDTLPRDFIQSDRELLKMLADEASARLRGYRRRLRLAEEIETRRQQQKDLAEQQRRLMQNEKMFQQMARLAKVGAWTYSPDTGEFIWSEDLYRILETEPGSAIRMSSEGYLIPEHLQELEAALERTLTTKTPMEMEIPVTTPKGNLRWMRLIAEAEKASGGRAIVIGTAQDVTARRRVETDMERLAKLDSLTGLSNRSAFGRRLEQLAAVPSPDGLDVLLVLDLDDFKDINDTLGHDAGDRLLSVMARRFRNCIREGDSVGRLGGDEFGIILRGRSSRREVEKTAALVLQAATAPIIHRGHGLRVGATAGIAVLGSDGRDAKSLLKAADIALYEAKRAGGERYDFYSAEIGGKVERRHRMFQEVRRGLEQGEFVVAYQPIMHLRNGNIRGFEALVRWNHPERGLLNAGAFLEALEDVAIGRLLSNAAMQQALDQLAAWRRQGSDVGAIGLNISAGQLRDSTFADDLLSRMRALEIPPEGVVIEITEGVLFGRGAENVIRRVKTLHEAGLRIALDDFGTGYASLSHLREMPVDTLKVDGSFVQAMTSQAQDRTIVRSVIDMAHGLGKVVVAEGVETREADALLNLMACEYGQGFHYGKPMLAAEVPDFIRAWSQAPARRSA